MANRNKFEEMLERLVNEDKEGAQDLFHEIVVEKSRDIYESLLEADLDDEEVDETTDEEVDESDDEEVDESDDEEVDESDDDEVNEDFDLDEFEVEADPMAMGGDETDDMLGSMGMDGDEGGMDDMEMGDDDDEEIEDRMDDMEDALDELKAEFEKMMSGDDADDEGDMDMDMDMDAGDEGDEEKDESFNLESTDDEVEESEEETDESAKSDTETMREYVEKINATMGDNGANAKSIVAGKNDMGGTSANIAKGGDGGAGGTAGGLSQPSTKEDNAGNVNVPGAKGASKMASQPGHGSEKKGKPETADKGAGSPLNGAPKRAK